MEKLLLKAPQAEVDYTYLYGIFRHLKHPKDKIAYLLKKGDLISVRRGLYVVSPDYGKIASTKVLSSMIYSPSYLSLQSALKYYGLIPDAIKGEVSVSLLRTNRFNTHFGEFEYHHSMLHDFLWGLRFAKIDQKRQVRMASPIKALYDLIRYSVSNYKQKSYDALDEYIDLMRLDLDDFNYTVSEYYSLQTARRSYLSNFLVTWLQNNDITQKDE
ncbi:hypothetical protein MHK_001883 [Candidatus Magnetomorum sp. HK-1]|nr:hypothetical protein MHK_001883 [Candidatus Magnetomorum sp. HK-1]